MLNVPQSDYMPNTAVAGAAAIINSRNVATFTDHNFVVVSAHSTVNLRISYVRIFDKFIGDF